VRAELSVGAPEAQVADAQSFLLRSEWIRPGLPWTPLSFSRFFHAYFPTPPRVCLISGIYDYCRGSTFVLIRSLVEPSPPSHLLRSTPPPLPFGEPRSNGFFFFAMKESFSSLRPRAPSGAVPLILGASLAIRFVDNPSI